jgi:hypothetical protein
VQRHLCTFLLTGYLFVQLLIYVEGGRVTASWVVTDPSNQLACRDQMKLCWASARLSSSYKVASVCCATQRLHCHLHCLSYLLYKLVWCFLANVCGAQLGAAAADLWRCPGDSHSQQQVYKVRAAVWTFSDISIINVEHGALHSLVA